MAQNLIEHLRQKTENHLELENLKLQWDYDQKLIPNALSNIVTLFPNYSRHDSSHSQKILVNIERILGENFQSMTATDTWLLLEAAYWHDIGMLATAKEINELFNNEEFKQYVKDIALEEHHELQKFAKQFFSMNPCDCFSSAETPQQAMELYRQLLSGWFRARHSIRATSIVDDPWRELGISSPRTELIPKRLFRILGQICKMHGENFETVIETLPFRETGMATESCHPRFIACLLRLGDLLDLDDNRFCPVMLRIAGDIPPSSQAHIDKHLGIKHFRLDPDSLEIVAECDGYDAYEATDQWFRWIEDELRNQMTRWTDIVPDRKFGLLPTLGRLEVNLSPPHQLLEPGRRPRFGVDQRQAIELIRGAGLYINRWQSVRELLQNAVDATLMRIWLIEKESPDRNEKQIEWENPLSQDVREIFGKYPIEVRITKCSEAEAGNVRYRLEIHDKGIGISKKDLAYIESIGASAKNVERRKIIDRMPKWIRPSGAFGIGLQSGFLLSPEICMETKSLLTDDMLKITLKSPLYSDKGAIFVQKSTEPPWTDFGTSLFISIDQKEIPERIFGGRFNSYTERVLAAFDPILMKDIEYESAHIVDEVIHFAVFSPLPIHLMIEDQCINLDNPKTKYTIDNSYYHPESGIVLFNTRFRPRFFRHLTTVAFRGQLIEKYHPSFSFVQFQADIMSEPAQNILTIDRNDVNYSKKETVYGLLADSISGYIANKTDELKTQEEKSAASAFLFIYEKEHLCLELKDEWTKMPLIETGCSISELCEKPSFDIHLSKDMAAERKTDENKSRIVVEWFEIGKAYYELLFDFWHKKGGFVQHDLIDIDGNSVLHFSMEKVPPYSEFSLRKVLLEQAEHGHGRLGGRCYMPVWDKYEELSAKVDRLPFCRQLSPYPIHKFRKKFFVIPFFFDYIQAKVTTDGLEQLCVWTMEHGESSGRDIDEIRDLYNEFIKWIDSQIMKDSKKWKELRDLK